MKHKFFQSVGQKLTDSFETRKPGLFCIAGGLMILGGSILLGFKAYRKIDEINDDHAERMSDLDITVCEHNEDGTVIEGSQRPLIQNRGGFILKNYAITTGLYIREFAIPFSLIIGGITMMGKGALEYKGRYLGAASALALRSAEFDALRARIIDRYGQEGYNLVYGVTEETEETVMYDENGNEMVTTKTTRTVEDTEDFHGHPHRKGYLIFQFDEYCRGYDADPYYALEFAQSIREWAENQVALRGRLLANDVLRRFDIDECKDLADANIGWNNKDPNYHGVSFGIELPYAENIAIRKNESTYKNIIILDFNCTGDVNAYGFKY